MSEEIKNRPEITELSDTELEGAAGGRGWERRLTKRIETIKDKVEQDMEESEAAEKERKERQDAINGLFSNGGGAFGATGYSPGITGD